MADALFFTGKDVAALLMAAKHGAQSSVDVRRHLTQSTTPSVRTLGTILLDETAAQTASPSEIDMAERLREQAR